MKFETPHATKQILLSSTVNKSAQLEVRMAINHTVQRYTRNKRGINLMFTCIASTQLSDECTEGAKNETETLKK